MLSAQSTDQRVNLTTPALFRKYRSVRALADADCNELEEMIKPVGLYHTKAANIIKMARKLADDFRGKVPTAVEELQSLPGVGRKSANVIRGELTGDGEGIAVDTHVTRVAFRLGFTKEKDPVKIEKDLTKVIDQKDWVIISHLLIYHGRAICQARRPACGKCVLENLCPRKGVIGS
jgi:endonuclease-3